jgi:hypothetical protein
MKMEMPEKLRLFLESLSTREAEVLGSWLDDSDPFDVVEEMEDILRTIIDGE